MRLCRVCERGDGTLTEIGLAGFLWWRRPVYEHAEPARSGSITAPPESCIRALIKARIPDGERATSAALHELTMLFVLKRGHSQFAITAYAQQCLDDAGNGWLLTQVLR